MDEDDIQKALDRLYAYIRGIGSEELLDRLVFSLPADRYRVTPALEFERLLNVLDDELVQAPTMIEAAIDTLRLTGLTPLSHAHSVKIGLVDDFDDSVAKVEPAWVTPNDVMNLRERAVRAAKVIENFRNRLNVRP